MHARIHAPMHARTHSLMHARTHARTDEWIHTRAHMHGRVPSSPCTHACMRGRSYGERLGRSCLLALRYPCMHARMHACTHAHTHTHTHARTHAHTHARTHARTYARTHACTHVQLTYVCAHAHVPHVLHGATTNDTWQQQTRGGHSATQPLSGLSRRASGVWQNTSGIPWHSL